jgi:hypothetical protein
LILISRDVYGAGCRIKQQTGCEVQTVWNDF